MAIAAGNGNCLLKSADSGASWKKLNLTSSSSTKVVSTAIIVCNDARIIIQ